MSLCILISTWCLSRRVRFVFPILPNRRERIIVHQFEYGANGSRYLTDLSEPLYDHVRPRIIHEPQIIALSELCLLFQSQFMRDPDEGNSPHTPRANPAQSNYFEPAQLDFGNLVQPALQDAQSRLVFRTDNLIVAEIQNFTPKEKDLDYPRLLHVTSGTPAVTSPTIKSPTLDAMSPSVEANEFFDSTALFRGWYPTLRKSIWILSKIYRLVNVHPRIPLPPSRKHV